MARYLEGGAEFIQQHVFFMRNGSFLPGVNRGGEERSLCACILSRILCSFFPRCAQILGKETPCNAGKIEF